LKNNNRIWILILISTIIRLVVAASLELGNDEVYYQTYAQHLQWNYFDHPPMVALLIRLFTFNLFFRHELFIRLGSIACSAAGTWLIFLIGKKISSETAAWFAAILYTSSLYSSVIAGIFILPDSPQVVFWLLSMYGMISILDEQTTGSSRFLFFIAVGISIGLSILSKVHGIFLWIGFGSFLLFNRRDLLITWGPWLAVTITLIIISPIYFWNLDNHFITYQYHQSRIGFFGNKPDIDGFLQQVFGSVLYSNPVNFLLYCIAFYALVKQPQDFSPYEKLLLWVSLPLIGVLLLTSVFNETLPHWSGPAYFSMMLIAGNWIASHPLSAGKKWLKAAVWIYAVVLVFGVLAINFAPLRLGSNKPERLGEGDITLDMYGWKSFALNFDSLYQEDIRSGLMQPGATIISDYWFPAGYLDHYFARPYHRNLIAFGRLHDIHHFAWLNARRPRLQQNADAYFIYPTNYYRPPAAGLREEFLHVDDSLVLPQWRSGHLVRQFVIYRMHRFRGRDEDYLTPGLH
jgi:Dolichyl-phosphate-mannose-protein mannosyltransferase